MKGWRVKNISDVRAQMKAIIRSAAHAQFIEGVFVIR